MENTFNLKKYLAEGKLTENVTDLVVTYYKDKDNYGEKGLADGFHTEDGKKVKFIVGYDDMDEMDDIGYIYSKSGADIETDYTEDDLDDAFMNSLNEVKKVVNEGALNFSPEEIEILKDGLGWILEYQEGVASDEYINAIKNLAMKLDSGMLQKVGENRALMPNASPEALARDVEQSDKEYIATRQKRDKIAQDLFKKTYRELNHIQKDKVNSKL
jgi:hypothetical protein